jgi:phosphopantothenoylcysteine decarboxylase / phosphopantothenate---cysteine ligase
MQFKDKNIVLCVTGGIAAYKAVSLASLLKKEGALVHVVMTKNAMEFVTPLTFKTITKNKVTYNMFDNSDFVPHISLSTLADIVIVAPATANIIAKAANGIADDMVSTTLLSSTAPKIIVPAMNTNMYLNPITQENISRLKNAGYYIMEPDEGMMACGTKGDGRFPEIEKIYGFILFSLIKKKSLFHGKKVLITTGGTIEDIDPVRCITNRSSGKMGFSFAEEFLLRGAKVTIIKANVSETVLSVFQKKYPNVEILNVRSAENMKNAVLEKSPSNDVIFMAAAVADFSPEYNDLKIKKTDELTLKLFKTEDILSILPKNEQSIYIGFAAETNDLLKNAKEKLLKKSLDFLIANEVLGESSAIGSDDAEVFLLNKWNDTVTEFGYVSKKELAKPVLDKIENLVKHNAFRFLK